MKLISTEHWTYERLIAELPAESQYELRDYNLIEMPAPKRIHQIITGFVYRALFQFSSINNLGDVYISPLDVIFDEGNTCQPDVIFLSKEQKHISREEGIFGTPDLLVEVVSKGSVVRDYVEKKNDYEKFGVQEYWLIDPLNQTIIVNALIDGKYQVFSSVEEKGIAQSKLLEGFQLGYDDVFVTNN